MDFNNNIDYLPVICISIRESIPDQIKIDKEYIVDRLSIYLDMDGDAYGMVYDSSMKRIGNMKLSHFRCK